MKISDAKTRAIHNAAFMLEGAARSSDVTEQLMPHARMLALNIAAYAVVAPRDVLSRSFVLLGCFEKTDPEYQTVSSFLEGRVNEQTVQPMAGIAEASMLTGPQRPDSESHEAGGFVVRILPDLTTAHNASAFESAGTVLMHSDAVAAQKRVSARFLKKFVHDTASDNLERASRMAALTVVAGGQLTPETEEMIAFQLHHQEELARRDPDRAYRSARNALAYSPAGSHEARFAEDRVLEMMVREARTGNIEQAVTMGWSLALAGSEDRLPRQVALQYMGEFKSAFMPQARAEFDALVTATPEARGKILHGQRKLQRNMLRGSQAARVLAGSLDKPMPSPAASNKMN